MAGRTSERERQGDRDPDKLGSGMDLLSIKIDGRYLNGANLKSLQILGNRAWWKRIRVIQEVILAQNAIIHCGKKKMPLELLINAFAQALAGLNSQTDIIAQRFGSNGEMDDNSNDGLFGAMMQAMANIANFKALYASVSDSIIFQYFVGTGMLVVARSYSATDDRDKIYGILGLCPVVADTIYPDYAETVDAVYIRAAVKITERLGALTVFPELAL
jgi:hypothetical protein